MVRRGDPRGLTLVETLAALCLLGMAVLMAAAIVIWASRVDERARQRADALELGRSFLEALQAVPYDSITSGDMDLGAYPNPPHLVAPGILLEVDEDPSLGLKEVLVVVTWSARRPGRLELSTTISRVRPYR